MAYMLFHITNISVSHLFCFIDDDLRCHMRMCSERVYNMLTCTESVILVDNVTSSGSAQRNEIGLLNLQRMCMGKQQCSIQSLCDFRQNGGSYVHYYCVRGRHHMKSEHFRISD